MDTEIGGRPQTPLPSNDLDIGLVGESEICQCLASAMLRISFDRKETSHEAADSKTDAAIGALRRILPTDSAKRRRRHVYTAETLQDLLFNNKNKNKNVLLDQTVLVLSIDDHEPESDRSLALRRSLDEIRNIRTFSPTLTNCSIVLRMESHIDTRQVQSFLGGRKRKAVPPGVEVFVWDLSLDNSQSQGYSARAVARRILRRARIHTRQGSSSLVSTSPLIVL